MVCKSCQVENVKEFGSEINIHFPTPEGLDEPAMFVFPKLVVCFGCGLQISRFQKLTCVS
jgi:hypothetical protein